MYNEKTNKAIISWWEEKIVELQSLLTPKDKDFFTGESLWQEIGTLYKKGGVFMKTESKIREFKEWLAQELLQQKQSGREELIQSLKGESSKEVASLESYISALEWVLR